MRIQESSLPVHETTERPTLGCSSYLVLTIGNASEIVRCRKSPGHEDAHGATWLGMLGQDIVLTWTQLHGEQR